MFAVSLTSVHRKRSCILFPIENTVSSSGTAMITGLYVNGYPATTPFDAPNVIICSLAEMEAATPSAELQAYKNMNVN
jgi:uncharacterized protein (DUF2237 family)